MKWIVFIAMLASVNSIGCAVYKQCCRRDFRGLECITMCVSQVCPVTHPIGGFK